MQTEPRSKSETGQQIVRAVADFLATHSPHQITAGFGDWRVFPDGSIHVWLKWKTVSRTDGKERKELGDGNSTIR